MGEEDREASRKPCDGLIHVSLMNHERVSNLEMRRIRRTSTSVFDLLKNLKFSKIESARSKRLGFPRILCSRGGRKEVRFVLVGSQVFALPGWRENRSSPYRFFENLARISKET